MDDMRPPSQPPSPERTSTQVRQAVPLHRMRYVLWVSILLAVIAFAIAYAVLRS